MISANSEGVIRIPAGCLETLPERATAMRAFEHEAHRAYRSYRTQAGDPHAISPSDCMTRT